METTLDSYNRYGYNTNEQLLMLFITGITNLGGIPVVIYLYKMKKYFESYISFFTIITSFMYHALDSIGCPKLFLTETQWHQLDNIGAITCFMIVFVHLMDNRNQEIDFQFYLGCFTISIMTQIKDPWNLFYTILPISFAVVVFMITFLLRRGKIEINAWVLGKSAFFLTLASFCFGRGLNEYTDYLRIFHGLWHFNVYIANFYFWQVKLSTEQQRTWTNFWKKIPKQEEGLLKLVEV